MARPRVVWVLIDGVGDVGLPCSSKQTPLQVPCLLPYVAPSALQRRRSVF